MLLNTTSKGGSSFLSAGLFPKASHIRAAETRRPAAAPLTRPSFLSDEQASYPVSSVPRPLVNSSFVEIQPTHHEIHPSGCPIQLWSSVCFECAHGCASLTGEGASITPAGTPFPSPPRPSRTEAPHQQALLSPPCQGPAAPRRLSLYGGA